MTDILLAIILLGLALVAGTLLIRALTAHLQGGRRRPHKRMEPGTASHIDPFPATGATFLGSDALHAAAIATCHPHHPVHDAAYISTEGATDAGSFDAGSFDAGSFDGGSFGGDGGGFGGDCGGGCDGGGSGG